MAETLLNLYYDIVSGGTDTHLVLMDLTQKRISGKKAELVLEKAGITTNKNMVPFDTESPFVTSGIRIGTPAITTRGLKEKEVIQIVELIDEANKNIDNDSALISIKKRVNNIMVEFPLFSNEW